MIGQVAHLRVLVAAVQVVGTFGAAGGVGGWFAAQQHLQGVSSAEADLRSADAAFKKELWQSLSDGTPAASLAELKAREAHVMGEPMPRPTFIVDRGVATSISDRTENVRRMTVDVHLREIDTEIAINQQLRDVLAAMVQDLVAAKDVGVDATGFDGFLKQARAAAGREEIPRLAQRTLDDSRTKDGDLKAITSAQIGANAAAAALQAAKDNAAYQRRRALGDLGQAQAIPVLDIHEVVAAITDLESRFPSAQTVDDFNNFAGGYAADARTLENLLYTRSNAYSLLASAEHEMARAQGAGADVGADAARISDLAGQLDRASNIASIQAVAGQLSFVIRDLEGLYFEARSRPFQPAGAIIAGVPFFRQVYSLSCEEAALQMALAYYGVNVNQAQVLGQIGVDRRPPQYDNGTLVWGDPYTSFVGNPSGYETANAGDPASGYGTYFPTIAGAATHFLPGSVAQAGEQISPDAVYAAAHNRQPVVAWVAFAYQPHPMRTMRTFSNRVVMYGAPWEHAVTISGWAPGYLLINNPHSHPEWIDAGTFSAAYAMFDNMAVILQRPTP